MIVPLVRMFSGKRVVDRGIVDRPPFDNFAAETWQTNASRDRASIDHIFGCVIHPVHPARHQDGTDQHPRCGSPSPDTCRRPHRIPGEHGTSSSVKALANAVPEIPTVSPLPSLATSTTPRAQPGSWTSGRASTVSPLASLNARRHPLVALTPRTERLVHHLLDHAGW